MASRLNFTLLFVAAVVLMTSCDASGKHRVKRLTDIGKFSIDLLQKKLSAKNDSLGIMVLYLQNSQIAVTEIVTLLIM